MALTDKLKAIADAIRSKTGDTAEMTLDEMPEKIASIEAGGSPTAPYIEETYDESGALTAVRMVGHSKVRAGMFRDCPELCKAELPSTVIIIDKYAFYNDNALTNVVLPDSITRIENEAFSACLCVHITHLPENLQYIGSYAFGMCSSTNITKIPSKVEYISDHAFSAGFMSSDNLVSGDIIFGRFLKEIGEYAFENCTGLTSLRFESTEELPIIDSTAFEGCGGILRIDVPWNEGDVPGAPWGATNATINYNYKE